MTSDQPCFSTLFVRLRHRVLWFWLLCLTVTGGCGAQAVAPRSAEDVRRLEPVRVVARPSDSGFEFDSYDAALLFERGNALLDQDQCVQAVEGYYTRLVREFPDSRYVAAALYNAGYCLQQQESYARSAEFYTQLLELRGDSGDAKHANLQLLLVLFHLDRWPPMLMRADALLRRSDLSSAERLEGMARRAQALLGLERLDDAEVQAREAVTYYRTRRDDEVIADPLFAAVAHFNLAEVFRVRADSVHLPEGTAEQQHAALEVRSGHFLQAQREYFNTMSYHENEWTAAAGFRIGEMFRNFWSEIMRAPVPPPPRTYTTTRAQETYRNEYRSELARQIRPLMRHAIRYWEMTLLLLERAGGRSEWAERTRQELDAMRNRLMSDQEDHPGAPADPIVESSESADPALSPSPTSSQEADSASPGDNLMVDDAPSGSRDRS